MFSESMALPPHVMEAAKKAALAKQKKQAGAKRAAPKAKAKKK